MGTGRARRIRRAQARFRAARQHHQGRARPFLSQWRRRSPRPRHRCSVQFPAGGVPSSQPGHPGLRAAGGRRVRAGRDLRLASHAALPSGPRRSMTMQFNPKLGFILGILITIEIAVSSGTLSLTHAVPAAWIPTVTAWSGILAFIGSTLLTFLHGYSSGEVGPLVTQPPLDMTALQRQAAQGVLAQPAKLAQP